MMKKRFSIPTIFGFVLALMLLSGCNLPNQQVIPPTGNDTPTTEISMTETSPPAPTIALTETDTPTTDIAITETSPPTPTIAPTETVTLTIQPLCTVLSPLNMRTGPGTPYRPPIRALPAGTELVPIGYNPVGIIGGAWVQIRDEARNEIGWVSAQTNLLTCNVDLNQYPQVNVPPPPPPPVPVVTGTGPDGGEQPDSWVWELDFNSTYFLRMRIFDSDSGTNRDGDGIANVTFNILDQDGNEIYKRTENTAAYCAFGGGEPDCNPWVIENFAYRWPSQSTPARSGLYTIIIEVEGTISDDFGDPRTGLWNLRDVSIVFP
jgi:hypothetical protein